MRTTLTLNALVGLAALCAVACGSGDEDTAGGAATGGEAATSGVTGGTSGLAGASSTTGGTSTSGGSGGDSTGGLAGDTASGGTGNEGGVGTTGGTGGGGGYPDTLHAIPANETIGLEWPVVADATSYNLYWSSSPGVTPDNGMLIADVDRGYVHRDLANGETYYYVVTAVTPDGETTASPEMSTTPGGEWVLEELGTGDFHDIPTNAPHPVIPIEQRIHVLLFGEGYTASELASFHDHADYSGARDNDVHEWVDLVFSIEPYSLFREAFVVWYIPRISNTDIRDPNPDTAWQVPVDTSSSFAMMGSIERDGATAQLAWGAIADHPYPPTDFSGPGYERARTHVAAFLIYDPDRGRASVSGRATSLENPNDADQRIASAFGVGHAHEFTHSFSSVRDEYLENDNSAPSNWDGTSNVVDTNVCSELPWSHLLYGTPINPDTNGLVGAFGVPAIGYHSELLCLMNGTHDNGEYYGDTTGGNCELSSCTLRVEHRMCNFCRETTTLRLYQRAGILTVDDAGYDEWVTNYRMPFYEQFEFQIPGVHFDGVVPQSNDRRDYTDGTQIFEACVP